MIHAFVLIKAEREAMHSLGGKLADVEGVTEAYSITGEWDSGGSAPYIRPPVGTPPDYSLRQAEELAELVTGRLSRIRGIRETHTMVAFEVFSEHDLEAMFSIGA
jgi:DNA-binding Lrp family transcriptional regulator